MSTVL